MVKAKTKDTSKTWLTIGVSVIILIVVFTLLYSMFAGKEGLVGEAFKLSKSVNKLIGKYDSSATDKDLDKTVDYTKKTAFEICNDGIDNNANGLTDCQEDTCISYQTCSPNCYKYTVFGKLDLSKFVQGTLSESEYPAYKNVKYFKYEFVNNDYGLLENNACFKRMVTKYQNSINPIKNIILYGDNFNCLEIYKGIPLISFNNYKSKPVYNVLGYDLLNKKIVLTYGDQLKGICPTIVDNLIKETVSSGWFFSWGFDDLKTLKNCLDEGINLNLIKTDGISNGEIKHPLDTFSCPEEICSNQKDDNNNGKSDCEDIDCSSYCNAPEICNNHKDDNGNLLVDCADYSSCEGKFCGSGCSCAKGKVSSGTEIVGYATEIWCGDQKDNDNDGKTDCDDSDCTADNNCVKKELCTNGLDDDKDNQVDCVDKSDCLDKSCGDGCLCVKITGFGNEVGSAKETNCIDQKDNDKDGKVDCGDSDCTDDSVCFVCTDTDGGKNYLVKGIVTDKYHAAGAQEDVCTGNYINEYYCKGNQYDTTTDNCLALFGGSAKCVNGACVYTKCKDSDNTYFPYKSGFENTFNSNSLLKLAKVAGVLSSGAVSNSLDFCPEEGGTKIMEGYCLNDYTAEIESFDCPYGSVCQKGACVMP